jgi:low affinity Fe/Cu permease
VDRDFTEDSHPAATTKTQLGGFSRLAHRLTDWTGSGWAALVVVTASLAWLAIGFAVDFTRWWELSATVGLPALTLLMLVLVQHTQNHNNRATQLKLDELIRATEGAHNQMMSVEDASRGDLNRIQADFRNQSGSPEAPV